MKNIIEAILRKAGWGLHKIDNSNRSTIIAGLNWLSDQNFHIDIALDVGASNGS